MPCGGVDHRAAIRYGSREKSEGDLGVLGRIHEVSGYRLDARALSLVRARELDWGGCRCQAFALTGDAANTDPACALSPEHDKLLSIARVESQAEAPAFVYRNFANALSPSHVASSAGAHRRKSRYNRGETEMDVRAAVAFEAGKPLSIETVQLEGPRSGEVLVELKATGICHTDEFTLSGADPEGLFPAILGHEGAGIVVDVGEGVKSVKPGDHVIPLYTPNAECDFCLNPKTNLCQKIRSTQGQGVMPDGTSRFSLNGKKLFHYMGTSTFSNYTVLPEIAVAKVRRDAPFDKICYIGCGVTTGIGAVIFTAKVEPGANVVVFGLGGIGLNVIQEARMVGADMIVGVDINPDKRAMAEKFGMTHFVNPNEIQGDVVAHLVELTGGGANYAFECVGNVKLMRQALECCHKGWGECIIIGVAGAGQEISTRPFQLVTGRVWRGSAFGGARGRTDVPKIVDWYMEGKINIDDLITHTMPLERINEAFDLMHQGKVDPQRRRTLLRSRVRGRLPERIGYLEPI